MTTKHHHIFFFLLFLGIQTALSAQDLPTGEVDVIKDFNARLIETEKFNLRPELPPLDTMTRRMTYDISARMLEVNYLPPKIRPLALRTDDNAKVYKGYARLGAGFPKALLAEAGYSANSQENFLLNLYLRHLSANNTDNLENQRFSNNDLSADGTYYFDQGYAVRGKVGYTQDNVFLYGYNDFSLDTAGISFASDDVKQRFSTLRASAEIFNGKRTQADFNYSAGLNFYHLQDLYSARENGIALTVKATKWFEDKHPLDVKLSTDFTSFRDTAKQTLNNIYLNPTYAYHGDRFRVKVGMNLASSNDEFFFFPDIEVAANVVEQVLTAYAGANGSLQKNNFQNLTDYNPFLSSRPTLKNTNYNYFYGGIKGEFFNINYQAEAGYKNAKDLALFLANQDTVPRFNVLYDTVNIFIIKGSLTMPLFDKLELTGTISQNIYSLNREEKAWHLPSLSANASAVYKMLDDKLRIRGDLFFENGVPYLDNEGKARNLNALFDISAGAEYQISDNLGGFIQVNNLLNNKRERWDHYPVMGLNAYLGLTARF